MSKLNTKNNAETILTTPVSASDTQFVVEDASALPEPPYRLTVNEEIVEVTAENGNTLTVVRAQEGTSASAHVENTKVGSRFTAGMYEELATIEELPTKTSELENDSDFATKEYVDGKEVDLSGLVTNQDYTQFKDDITAKVEGARTSLIESYNSIIEM